MFGRRRILLAAGAVLVGAAVAEELMKPREQRTWEGRILDLIPYDLRIAPPEGFREAKANPSQARIVLGYRLDLENAVKFARRRFRL